MSEDYGDSVGAAWQRKIASLRADLAAEREAHALARAVAAAAEREADRLRHGNTIEADHVCPAELERDAAIARAETAERERDEFRRIAEASLVRPCACGRPMPSVSSRLRCDACRAEGERDEARARLVSEVDGSTATLAALRAVIAELERERDEARAAVVALREMLIERDPHGEQRDVCDWCCETWPVGGPEVHADDCEVGRSDAGAPLLAELRALRAVRDAVEAWLTERGPRAIAGEPGFAKCGSCGRAWSVAYHGPDGRQSDLHPGVTGHAGSCGWVVLRAAINAAKAGG